MDPDRNNLETMLNITLEFYITQVLLHVAFIILKLGQNFRTAYNIYFIIILSLH